MQKPDLSLFPEEPGVYLYKDAAGRIVYVGKAKRLRRRIASYFRADDALSPKTRLMLQHAVSIEILRTATEKEALLLEASLIKKHRPRYNIVLRDDKEYLLFRIGADHPFPRLEVVRRTQNTMRNRRARLFGPFSSGQAARETWKLIHKYFQLRRCRDSAFANRTRPCLYHDIGQCLAPCVLDVSEEAYKALIDKAALLLSGKSRELVNRLAEEMAAAADALRFEEAAKLRDQIRAVERTLERQSVVLPKGGTLDLVGVAQLPEGLALGVVFVREGLLLDRSNFFWPGLSVEDTPELLTGFLSQYYLNRKGLGESLPPRIVVPWLPEPDEDGDTPRVALEAALAEIRGAPVTVTAPVNHDEDALVLMASANAREAAKTSSRPEMANLLAKRLNAPSPIRRIEAVDISHTGGSQTRAGMVVFEDEQPLRDAYRNYALDDDLEQAGAEEGDDYAALAIWARRRTQAALEGRSPWSDMVLIDGGKGQLAAVHRAFTEAGAGEPFPFVLASIAKARDEEGHADRRAGNTADRIFLPGRSNPAPFPAGSPELLFLQRVRDAVHDFVIGRHRRARAAATLSGELTRIPGVGPKLAKVLFDHFGSLADMAQAGEQALAGVPGIGRAKAAAIASRLAMLMEKGDE